jgi:WD40 repeat protein
MTRIHFILVGLLLLFGDSTARAQKPPRTDRVGDPLPTGVLARIGSIRLNCNDGVGAATFAPDGKSLAVIGVYAREKQLWLFDAASGKTMRRLSLPQDPSEHHWTADGRFRVVRVFYQKSLDPNAAGVTNFGEIHVLDGETLKPIWKTEAKYEFRSMALSADGKLLAGGTYAWPGKESTIHLWETATGKQLGVLKGHVNTVTALAFTTDGQRLLSASANDTPVTETKAIKGNVCLWEAPAGKLIKKVAVSGWAHAFSPLGTAVAIKSGAHWRESKSVSLWDLKADKEIANLPVAHASFLFTPGGRGLLTGSVTDILCLWDARTGRKIRRFKGLVGNGTRPLAISPDGKRLASSGQDNAIRLWDVATGEEQHPYSGHYLDIGCLAFSPDGKKLVSGSDDRTARIWETVSGKEMVTHEEHKEEIAVVAFAPDGLTVASGDRANVTHIWDARTGKLLQRLTSKLPAVGESRSTITALAFSPDGKSLWVGSRTLSIRGRTVTKLVGELAVYETATGKRKRALKEASSYPRAVSPNAGLSVWIGRTRSDSPLNEWAEKVVVRRLATGKAAYAIVPNKLRADSYTEQVVFSPDGKKLAINSRWHAVGFTSSALVPCYRLLNAQSGKDIVNRSSADYPWSIFTADGRVLVGVYDNKRLLAPIAGPIRVESPSLAVLDAVGEKNVGSLPSYPTRSLAWAFAPNGQYFAAVSQDRTVLIWEMTRHCRLKKLPRR